MSGTVKVKIFPNNEEIEIVVEHICQFKNAPKEMPRIKGDIPQHTHKIRCVIALSNGTVYPLTSHSVDNIRSLIHSSR